MTKFEKFLSRMRDHPRGDWRMDDLMRLADHHGIPYRQRGSHVTFTPPGLPSLTVPAARPVRYQYVEQFVSMIDRLPKA